MENRARLTRGTWFDLYLGPGPGPGSEVGLVYHSTPVIVMMQSFDPAAGSSIVIPVPDSWWICWILEPPFPIMASAKSFGMPTCVVVVCWFPNIIPCPPIAPIVSLLKPLIPLPQHTQLTVDRTASTLWCLHQFALKFPDLESCMTDDATSLALGDQHTNYSFLYSTHKVY